MNDYNAKCIIWDTPAKDLSTPGVDGRTIDSPRAGGKYKISGSAVAIIQNLSASDKVRLTNWLIKQRNQGENTPYISTDMKNTLMSQTNLSIESRTFGLLKYLGELQKDLSERFSFSFSRERPRELFCIAHSGSVNGKETYRIFEYLNKMEMFDIFSPESGMGIIITLSFKAHETLEGMDKAIKVSSQAFVAMWFDDSLKTAYEKGILPAVEDAGYKSFRIDRKEYINKIDDEIVAEIRRSRFLIADFTQDDKKGARGGVYYEAGFAHGLNIPVIFTCKRDAIGKVHFDTRQYNHILWDNPADLRTKLKNRIEAIIGEGPLKNNLS